MAMTGRTLTQQIFLALSPLVALFFIGVIWLAMEYNQSLQSIRKAQVSNLANYLASSLEIPLGTADYAEVQREIARSIKQVGIMRITIVMPGQSTPIYVVNPQYASTVDLTEKKALVTVPIRNKFGGAHAEHLGELIIEEDIRQQTDEMWRIIGYTSGALFLGVLLLTHFMWQITHKIRRPVERLRVAVESITQGDLNFPFEPITHNELRPLESTVLGLMEALRANTLMHQENQRLEQEASQARESKRVRTELLAHISHEIRNPLHAICGYSGMLVSEPEVLESLSVANQSRLRTISKSAHHLTSIVSDMLDFARLEAGAEIIEVQPVDLWGLLEDLCDIHAVRARGKGVGMDLVMSPVLPRWIEAGEGPLRKVIGNLLSNATKFTEQGFVQVEAEMVRIADDLSVGRGRDWIIVRVIDTGPGLGGKDMTKLAEAFWQADSGTTKTHEGSGLGLAIAARYMDLMGGYIRIIPMEDGAGFEVGWPVSLVSEVGDEKARQDHGYPLSAIVIAARETQRQAISGALIRNGFASVIMYESLLEVEANFGFPFDLLVVTDNVQDLDLMTSPCRLARKSVLLMSREDAGRYAGAMNGEAADLHLLAPLLGEEVRTQVLPLVRKDRKKSLPTLSSRLETSARVLVVDDEETNIDVIRAYLTKLGVKDVSSALSGLEALHEIRLRPPFDLIITDLHMPKMDGYELIQKIRQHDAFVPIAALTADNQRSVVERLQSMGVRAVMGKPLSFQKLSEIVSPIVGGADETSEEGVDLSRFRSQYLESMRRHAERLEAGMRGEDEHVVREALHTMVGNAGLMREVLLAERLSIVSEHVKDGRWSAARGLWSEINGGLRNAENCPG